MAHRGVVADPRPTQPDSSVAGEYLELRDRDLKPEAKASLADTSEHVIELRSTKTGLEHELQRFLVVGGFLELLLAAASGEASEVLRSHRILRSDAVQRAIFALADRDRVLSRAARVLGSETEGIGVRGRRAADEGVSSRARVDSSTDGITSRMSVHSS